MTYNKSQKVIDRMNALTDWEQRLTVFRMRNKGLTFAQIGERIGSTRQNAQEIYDKVSKMTLQEIIDMTDKFSA